MIGLSLSFCVKEIINQKVNLKDVEKIIAGTMIHDRIVFENVMRNNYAPIYWKKDPAHGMKIALKLWDEGKIDQPRTRGEEHPGLHNGVWI